MNLSIFTSRHSHNNTRFNMVHIVCPTTRYTTDIFYEIQGNMNTSLESTIHFDETLNTPYILSFFGKKGEMYFIRIKTKDENNGKESKVISFYKYPDDYNLAPEKDDETINIEITKKKEPSENNTDEDEDKKIQIERQITNMILNNIDKKCVEGETGETGEARASREVHDSSEEDDDEDDDDECTPEDSIGDEMERKNTFLYP